MKPLIKYYKIIIISLLFSIVNQKIMADTLDSLNINQLIQLVDSNSKNINIYRYKKLFSQQNIKDVSNQQLPNITIFGEIDKASNMPVYTSGLMNKPEQHEVVHTLYQSGANMYINIYNGWKVQSQKSLSKLQYQLTNEQYTQQRAVTILQAIHLYYDLYLQYQLKNIIKADILEKEEQVKEISILYNKGVVLESDVLRAKLEMANSEIALVTLLHDIDLYNQQLNVLMGKKDSDVNIPTIESENTEIIYDLDSLLTEGAHNAYEEKISKYHVAIEERKVALTKADNAVQLGVVGSFQFSNPQIFLYPYNTDWYSLGIIGLKLQYNISSLYHNKYKVNAAKIAVQESHLHHHQVQDNIRTKIYEAYHNYDEALKYIPIKEKKVNYAKENERIVRNAYFSQTALITDLLDANVIMLQSQFEYQQAKIQVLKQYYSLAFAIGKL